MFEYSEQKQFLTVGHATGQGGDFIASGKSVPKARGSQENSGRWRNNVEDILGDPWISESVF